MYPLLPTAESQDNELDAILGELCALGSQFEKELHGLRAAADDSPPATTNLKKDPKPTVSAPLKAPDSVGTIGKFDRLNSIAKRPIRLPASYRIRLSRAVPQNDSIHGTRFPAPVRSDGRTDSPDNDSAFSDSISMLSGESSASSGARTSSSQESGKREGTLGMNEEFATAACLHDVQTTQVSATCYCLRSALSLITHPWNYQFIQAHSDPPGHRNALCYSVEFPCKLSEKRSTFLCSFIFPNVLFRLTALHRRSRQRNSRKIKSNWLFKNSRKLVSARYQLSP